MAATLAGLAKRIVDLLLEAERELQETPTHSRTPSGAEQDVLAGWAGGEGLDAGAQGELQQAVEAMAAGEERRAVQHLQRAQAACPDYDLSERRRIALYLQLVRKS